MTSLTLTVTVEPFGERQRATVCVDDLALSIVVRDGARDAVEVAMAMAAADVAAELCPLRSFPPSGGPGPDVRAMTVPRASARRPETGDR